MKKHRLFLVCGLSLFMVGCQASQSSKTTEPSKASQETSVKKEDQVLERGQWEDKLYKKLSNVIKENGKTSSKYDESAKPYAVFDWDNTTVINDIGEATFTYQIENLEFKMTPEELDKAIRTNIPEDNFKEEHNNKEGNPVNIDKIAKDIVSDYTVIYNEYKGFKGSKSLEEVKQLDEYKDFSAKLRYLYEAIGGTFSSDISYPWVTYLFTGMTSKEVQAVSEKSIERALKEDLVYETWVSPENLKGEAGQVEIKFKRGVRAVKEMQNLYKTLQDNGIDVYVVSASFRDVIVPFATKEKFGYNITEDHVYGMELVKNDSGVIQSEYNNDYFQTQGEGKTKTIKKFIADKHGNQDPILIAGDSNGDYAMLKDFEGLQMGIIFNLLRDPSKGIGLLSQTAVDTYDSKDAKYFLQGRDENKGVLVKSRETIKLGTDEAQLIKK